MSQSERLRARLERRRSSAASPHRNRSKFYKGSRNDWKGMVDVDSELIEWECFNCGAENMTFGDGNDPEPCRDCGE